MQKEAKTLYPTDEAILQGILLREEDALAAMLAKYFGYLQTIAFTILKNHEDAEEIASDALHRAWESILREEPKQLKWYLVQMTRNLAIDRAREDRAQKRGGGELPLLLSELEDTLPDGVEALPEAALEAGYLREVLMQFLSALSWEKRTLFIRRYYYGESIVSLSQRTGSSETALKKQLARLRKRLMRELQKNGLFPAVTKQNYPTQTKGEIT